MMNMAEPTTTQITPTTELEQTTPTGGEQPNYDAIFAKLDAILDKRSDGIGRRALVDNGIAEAEAKEIVAAYRQQKGAAAQRQADAMSALEAENAQLKAQMLESRLQTEAMSQAGTLGVAAETMPYLLRLADLSGAVDDKGEIQAEAVTEALNKVLTDIPALKQTKEQARGFVPVGGDGKDRQSAEADDRMRSWFSLPPKK